MNKIIEIEELDYSEINYLIEGFKIWYQKNGSKIDESALIDNVKDMYQSSDTNLFKLKEKDSIIGVFFTIDLFDCIEIGGGLLGTTNNFKNTYYVFDFCIKMALSRKKNFIRLIVINNHYSYLALLRYYTNYGFILSKIDDNKTTLELYI
jgi:hypothetical protein